MSGSSGEITSREMAASFRGATPSRPAGGAGEAQASVRPLPRTKRSLLDRSSAPRAVVGRLRVDDISVHDMSSAYSRIAAPRAIHTIEMQGFPSIDPVAAWPVAPAKDEATWGPTVQETSVRTDAFDGLSKRFDLACHSLAALALGQKTDDVTGFVKETISTLDLKHVSYVLFHAKRSEDLTLLGALVTYPMDWQLRYFARRYHQVDPVIVVGLTAVLPLDWRSFRNSSPKTSAFMADAASYGLGANGVTIPVRNRPNAVGLVSFTSDLADPEWEEYTLRYMDKLQVMACLIAAAWEIKTKLYSATIDLTKREEQALAWAARGKTANETANILNVSYATVKTYLENARGKLGCANVTHAVAAAIVSGLIPAQVLKGTNTIAYSDAGATEIEALRRETTPAVRMNYRDA